MKMPSLRSPACNGVCEVPRVKFPTAWVRPLANENTDANGTYSPNGTRWILLYRPCHSPAGLTSDAELNTVCGLSTPIEPTTTQACDWRAKELMASRKTRWFVWNGAGDSGQTIKSGCCRGGGDGFRLKAENSCKVRSK